MRGLAALWVLIGHTMLLTGFNVPIASQPDLGVDLFIMLSGFLMTYQYQSRSGREDWSKWKPIVAFWLRRFFRLAPLYYITLAFAVLFGHDIYENRLVIDHFLARSPQSAARYLDDSVKNIVLHMSFLYGLLPSYAYRTPLPDWSLGLEMQFYAVFPSIVILARRFGWTTGLVVVAAAGVAIAVCTGKAGMYFPMPSFLPLKLHVFIAGMLIASAMVSSKPRLIHVVLIMGLVAVPIGGTQNLIHAILREIMALGFAGLVLWDRVPAVAAVAKLLGSRVFHWLGELSYGVYLIHLLVLQPVAGWLIRHGAADIGASERFLLVFAVVAPLSYLGAAIGYVLIEGPGQSLGRWVIRSTVHRGSESTAAERIAAP